MCTEQHTQEQCVVLHGPAQNEAGDLMYMQRRRWLWGVKGKECVGEGLNVKVGRAAKKEVAMGVQGVQNSLTYDFLLGGGQHCIRQCRTAYTARNSEHG